MWADNWILQILQGIGIAFVCILATVVITWLIALTERNPDD